MLKSVLFLVIFLFSGYLFAQMQTLAPVYAEARAYELKKGYENPSPSNGMILSKWQAKKLLNMIHDEVFWVEGVAPCFEAEKSVIFYDSLHKEVLKVVISPNCNAVLSKPSQFFSGQMTMQMSDLGAEEITNWMEEIYKKCYPAAPKDVKKTVYTVKRGDTWKKLATTYNTTPEILYAFNHGTAGQGPYENEKLVIYEGLTSCKYPAPKPATPITQTPPKSGTHVVQAKETLYSISRLYATTPAKIQQLNGLKSNAISIGQVLKVK